MPRLGLHIPTGAGLPVSARVAVTLGCETIQIFTGSPVTWSASELHPDAVAVFRATLAEHHIAPIIVHAPYLVNLATADPVNKSKSRQSLSTAMYRAALLGASYVVTHIGSHKGAGIEVGLDNVTRGVERVLRYDASAVMLLLENGSGGGNTIGSNLSELRAILDALSDWSPRVGVCLDTAHLWGAGYDVATPEKWTSFLDEFDQTIGLARLRLIHINDSGVPLGSRRDLHRPPGQGAIGMETFIHMLTDPRLTGLPLIMELPTRLESPYRDQLRQLKELRDQLSR